MNIPDPTDAPVDPGHSDEYTGAPVPGDQADSGATPPRETEERHSRKSATDAETEKTSGDRFASSQADSDELQMPTGQNNEHTSRQNAQKDEGEVPSARLSKPAGGGPLTRTRDPLTVTMRLRREGRWVNQAEHARDAMMRECRKKGLDKDAAQQWVYGELDRMYPPLANQKPDPLGPVLAGPSAATDSGAIHGLSDLPKDWPELPANSTLAAEIGWVQANRLRMVEDRPGGATRVRLDQALTPAPSWAALGWLETSIRSYAKYVDVAAKATASDGGDESAVMKRERRSIEEVKRLLAEMDEDGDGD